MQRFHIFVLLSTLVACGDASPMASLTEVRDATDAECPAGGVVVLHGADEDRDGILGPAEVTRTTPICNGEDGAASLIRTSDEPAGDNCAAGGVRIDVGSDTNDDGDLDDDEVQSTQYLCDQLVTLIATIAEGATLECAEGGVRIDAGLDLDGDHVLDDGEVTSSERVCHGSGGDVVVARLDFIASGDDGCPTGGRWLHVGVDEDGDGELGDDEISDSTKLCDAGYAALVRTEAEPAGLDCAAGGLRVHDGLDTNGNGALDDEEIAHTAVLCHGSEANIASYQATLRAPEGSVNYGAPIARGDVGGLQVLVVGRNNTSGPVVYERASAADAWAQVATLPAAFPQTTLAFAGSTLLAGASEDTTGGGHGAIYVYERGASWSLVETIRNPWVGDAHFASDLYADGDRFVAAGGSSPGHSYVYERSGGSWTLAATITTAGGHKLAGLSGDVLAVQDYGHVYMYDRVPASGTWAQTAVLEPWLAGFPVGSVGLSGSLLVMGAPRDGLGNGSLGAALVFKREDGSWLARTALRVPFATGAGSRVAVAGDRVVFTAYTAQFGNSSSVYLADENPDGTWDVAQELVTPDRVHDGFGVALAATPTELWVGDLIGSGPGGNGPGSAHGFDLR